MRRFALVLPLLALAGCQTLGLSGGSAPSEPASMPAAEPTTPPRASAAPAAATGLIGMSGEALRTAWGEPVLKRAEAGAELWQYGGRGNCTLLVYFYANAASVMTVTHAEAVPGGSDEAAVTNCAKAAGKPPLKPVS